MAIVTQTRTNPKNGQIHRYAYFFQKIGPKQVKGVCCGSLKGNEKAESNPKARKLQTEFNLKRHHLLINDLLKYSDKEEYSLQALLTHIKLHNGLYANPDLTEALKLIQAAYNTSPQ